ncbi:unnamed protein product [Allacma fusca]|uniref:Uncharacterized protein n=1 Tax=Allacma fusca TaxID=39272 RepID=A0A8J2KAX1_9HEXA|nr:unnamed protein product [Allacma fusca]
MKTVPVKTFLLIFGANVLENFARSEEFYNSGPLFLSPYILQGRIQEARRDSKVNNKIKCSKNIESYSGYLTVNFNYNSNLFFWFFPAETKQQNAPLVLFLNGGPGEPSTSEVFLNGPLKFNKNGDVDFREKSHSWTSTQSIIYLDSPVGTGFSFTDDPKGYSQNNEEVVDNIYLAFMQFLQIFYEYKDVPFYIVGLSYGGKFATALAQRIDQANSAGPFYLPLKGLLLLNPLLDPVIQSRLAHAHYNFGLYDENTRIILENFEEVLAELVKTNEIPMAAKLMDEMYGIHFNTTSIFHQKSGYKSIYEGLLDPDISSERFTPRDLIQQNKIRNEIHAGDLAFSSNSPTVILALLGDLFSSVSTTLGYLLASGEYKIWIVNCQLDLLLPPSNIDTVLKNLAWAGYNDFFNAEQSVWRSEGQIAGYCKQCGHFTRVILRLAGHTPYFDVPQWTAEILGKFLH